MRHPVAHCMQNHDEEKEDFFTLLETECEDYWNYILKLLIWLLLVRLRFPKSGLLPVKTREKMSSMLAMLSLFSHL